MLKNKNVKNNFGFSLAEMVVSAGIIAMISALVLANLHGSTQRSSLDNEAERLSSLIRQANINSLIGLTTNGVRPTGGYGLHVDTCTANCFYLLFADINGDHLYTSAADVIIQRFGMLDDAVYVNQFVLPPSGSPSSLDLVFVPPQGLVYINGVNTYAQATITLGFKASSYTKKIILNSQTGRVDLQ